MEEPLHQIYLEQSAREADELVQFPCEEKEQKAVYFLKCTHFWPEFRENESFPYCVNHVCDYQKPIDADTQEQADLLAAQANADGVICPKCGWRAAWKGASQFEIYNDRRILASINRSELNHG